MKRDYGLDVYKIIATFMVFILHISDQGGVIRTVKYSSIQYIWIWFLIAFAYCAVNCFGLASGYLLVNKEFRYYRIINLWLEVSFYSLGINTVFLLFNIGHVSLGNWIAAAFPVLMREYWYFTAYFGLFFFIPFFNKMIRALNKKQQIILLLTIVIIISVLSSINREIFYLKSGYSMLWLCSLYVVGGIIRQLDVHLTRREKVIGIVWCVIFALLATFSRMVIHYLTIMIFGSPKFEGGLYLYASPLVLFTGIVILLISKDVNISNPLTKRIVIWLSNASFGCYLIQVHPLVFGFFRDKFSFLAHQNSFLMIFFVLIFSTCGLVLFSIIDWIRANLFKTLKINVFSLFLTNKVSAFMNKLINIV